MKNWKNFSEDASSECTSQASQQSMASKFFSAVDCDNFYTTKLEIYSGKSSDPNYNKFIEVVERIVNHLLNFGRNITMDNWFTSFELLEWLTGY